MLLCLGPVRTQQSFNKWGLVKLNSAVHKNTGNFASLTKRARSTSSLLISSVNILLCSKTRRASRGHEAARSEKLGSLNFPPFCYYF